VRRRTLILLGVAGLVLILAPSALATAGGGSAGFSGGGGGGGGGHGSGFALYIIIDLLIHIALLGHGLGALFLIALGLLYLFVTKVLPSMQASWATRTNGGPRKHNAKRERRVELAAAEAAEDDPDFSP
jgi:hypothetical protein